ncbi:MAG: DHA2 family efflux MFS transporter permease subunit, partial [Sphingomonadales bacterium]|nr:DHA2 family efflux MFS transporter permease subunit [Sphingomonadales bacterium]
MVASMLCGAARNLESMVAFRAAQGVFAAFLTPLSQAVMLDINPKEKHARAMSIWGTGVMIWPIMGPLLGGWLTESFNWRWIFFVNLPISILCLAILIWLLPSRPKRQRRFDFIGFGYLALALGAFQLMLDRGQTLDWFASGEILIEACVAAGAFWMFIVHLLTAKTPLFERALFSDRNMIWGTGVMIGPIMGPLLGGWLTESFNWRWIFFVNLPISILCLAILIWLLPSRPKRQRRFDFIGFGYLALALGAFQLMLDRGQTLDWFASGEILIEACVAAGAFWMFIVHLLTAKTPLFERALFSDRNMLTGTGFMLIMGVLILAVMALLPPLLQNLYGYSVFETGVLLMPRGVGIVLTMIIAGILTQRGVDARLLVGLGFVIAALSLYRMTGWSTVISREEIMIAGFIQGLGMGLIFIPLNLVAFATLAPHQRTEGSSLLQLSRSLGGSIGISLVSTNLVRQAQASHAEISSELTSAGTQGYEAVARSLGIEPEFALRLIEMEIRRQSTMVAYLDDFMLLAILTAVAVPLVMLLRKGDPAAAGNPPAALE